MPANCPSWARSPPVSRSRRSATSIITSPSPAQMLRTAGSHYALEVKGDSMIDAGINDGDVVIIRETSSGR